MYPNNFRIREIKPVIAGYLRSAQSLLMRDPLPKDDVIHDVRVLMKKSRSALKLVAAHLDTEFICRDINAQKQIGQKMCLWRESNVLRKNLRELRKEFPSLFSRLEENELIGRMLTRTDREEDPSGCIRQELGEITELLRKSAFRIRFQPIAKIAPQLLLADLGQSFDIVMATYLHSRNNPRAECIHEFRKKLKDFLYQLYFFRPMNPSQVKSTEKRLEAMSRNLGRYNDLSQLLAELGYSYSPGKNITAIDELVLRIRDKQDRYLSKVWPAAFKLFGPGQTLSNLTGLKLLPPQRH